VTGGQVGNKDIMFVLVPLIKAIIAPRIVKTE